MHMQGRTADYDFHTADRTRELFLGSEFNFGDSKVKKTFEVLPPHTLE